MDPQQIARSLNRLAYGGERGDNGQFELSTLGRMLISSLGNNIGFLKNISRLNQNAAANFLQVTREIKDLGVAPEFLAGIKSIAASKEGLINDPYTVYKKINNIYN